MNRQKKDLNILPKGMSVPTRPAYRCRARGPKNIIRISKSDYEYIEERRFEGRFAITNKMANGITTAYRLAAALDRDGKIVLSISGENRTTKMPDGATWRTVRLVSAFKTEDGKPCVIEIEPLAAKGGEK